MEENKVRYGLCNVHVGTVTMADSAPTFSVPKLYPGAVNMTLNAQGEQSIFYADNIAYYVTNTNNGYEGELEMAYLYDWFEKEFLGNIESQEGMIIETSEIPSVSSYLMFQFEGDKNATKYMIYNTTFSRPNIEGGTKQDTTEPQTTTIPFTSVPLVTEFGNIVRAKVPKAATNYETFFKEAPTVPTKKTEPSSEG